MEGAGDEVLAGPGLAQEEDGGVGGSDLLDLGEDPAEGGARAHHLVEAVSTADLLLEDDVLRLEALLELVHLPQARLQRSLRLLQLRHIRVHEHEAVAGRTRRDGDVIVAARLIRWEVRVARPEIRDLAGQHGA